jgi:aminopeptidase
MSDPRVKKLAQIMVKYSLNIKPGHWVHLMTSPLADEFNLAFIEEVTKAGGLVFTTNAIPGATEVFLKNASNKQLDTVNPVNKMIVEKFDARMIVQANANTRELSGVDPKKTARAQKANAPLFKTMLRRMENNQLAYCITLYATNALAQEANMSLSDYREFVFEAGMLNAKDPVAKWKSEEKKQKKLAKWLKGKNNVILKGDDVDLTFSIKGRTFITAAGDTNFPDGEIFTSPVEESVNGWVRFNLLPSLVGRRLKISNFGLRTEKLSKKRPHETRNFSLPNSIQIREHVFSANGALERITISRNFRKICSSMRSSVARYTWPWGLASGKPAAGTYPVYIGICYVT